MLFSLVRSTINGMTLTLAHGSVYMSTPSPTPMPYPLHAPSGVAGNTTVLTRTNGAVAINTLVGQSGVAVWDGSRWIPATVYQVLDNEEIYTVTLGDGRSLQCGASYPWYVQTPLYTTFAEIKTEFLGIGSALWWTTLETDVEGAPPSSFPTVASVVDTGTKGPLYCIVAEGLTLTTFNGILGSVGYMPSVIIIPPAPSPTPTPTPSPTPTPTPSPAPSPGGYQEPVPATHSDAFYLGALVNGTLVTVPSLNTNTNTTYTQDPYYTFMLPAGATGLSAMLTDNSTGDFQTSDGWLMLRRGDRPSSNDTDQNANDFVAESPTTPGLYSVVVPDATPNAGEWYVSLDVEDTNPIAGMTLSVFWTHPVNMPSNVPVVTTGSNGTLEDGQDFLFNIPTAPNGSTPSTVYWEVNVPAGYTLAVTLDDNEAGQLAAQLSNEDVGLIFSINEPFSASFDPANSLGLNAQAVPIGLIYYNDTGGAITVYVSVGNYNVEEFDNVRLLTTVVPASYVTLNAGGGNGITGNDVFTMLSNANIIASTSLDSPIQDWVPSTGLTYTQSNGSSQVVLPNAAAFWDSLLAASQVVAGDFTGVLTPPNPVAQFGDAYNSLTSVAFSENAYVMGSFGFTPFYYAPDENNPSIVLAPSTTNTLFSSVMPLVVYLREVFVLEFADSMVSSARSFVEFAIWVDTQTQAEVPTQYIVSLESPGGSPIASMYTAEQVFVGSGYAERYKLYVYRNDASNLTTGQAYSSIVGENGVNTAALTPFLTFFTNVAGNPGNGPVPGNIVLSQPE
jgi:hypothetical protein